MSKPLRSLIVGLFAGLVLSAARAPLGLDLFSIPAVFAIDSAAYRAFALGALAMALGTRATRALPSVSWAAAGAALGFGLHGFFAAGCIAISGFSGLAILIGLTALVMGISAGPATHTEPPEPGHASRITQLGLVLAGAGTLLAIESIARPLRLLGLGTTDDDTAFGFGFLCLLAIGAISFRSLVDSSRRGRPSLAAGLALCSASCLYGVAVLAEFSSRLGLDAYLRIPTWGLDTSYIGMLQGDLLIGGRTLLLPAFILGAALCGARHAQELSRVFLGAAIALLALAVFGPSTVGAEEQLSTLTSAHATLGITLAGLGALVALAGEATWRTPASLVGLLVSAAALVLPRVLPEQHVLPLSPWEQFPPSPQLLSATPEGLLTVESVAGGGQVLTLDRRRLTPSATGAAADAQRLRLSWDLLTEAEQGRGRVLLIGQLTPLRARVLTTLGASRIDRTGAWHASMPAIEQALFGGETSVAGDILAAGEARQRLDNGGYDLVIVPPAGGSTPVVDLGAAGDTPTCVWIATDQHAAWRDWGELVLLSSTAFDDLHLGLTNRPMSGLPAGAPRPFGNGVRRLLTRPFERGVEARATITQRLASAADSSARGDLAAGLALHYAAQRRSSPWETDAQQIEVSASALEHLRDATLASTGSLDTFLRELWEGIAMLLVEKREIELAYTNLVPLAEAFSPWPKLERALAAADIEMLDPASAADRLLIVIAAQPYDLNLRASAADALAAAGRPAEAAEQCRAALAVQPGRRDFERRLAAALVMSGDPEGRILIEDLLLDDPDDHELEAYLEPGPHEALPPPAPEGDRHDH